MRSYKRQWFKGIQVWEGLESLVKIRCIKRYWIYHFVLVRIWHRLQEPLRGLQEPCIQQSFDKEGPLSIQLLHLRLQVWSMLAEQHPGLLETVNKLACSVDYLSQNSVYPARIMELTDKLNKLWVNSPNNSFIPRPSPNYRQTPVNNSKNSHLTGNGRSCSLPALSAYQHQQFHLEILIFHHNNHSHLHFISDWIINRVFILAHRIHQPDLLDLVIHMNKWSHGGNLNQSDICCLLLSSMSWGGFR